MKESADTTAIETKCSACNGRSARVMKWDQVARHTAVAIGITFVVVAGFYLMVRILLFAL
jgi:hypothetical protein